MPKNSSTNSYSSRSYSSWPWRVRLDLLLLAGSLLVLLVLLRLRLLRLDLVDLLRRAARWPPVRLRSQPRQARDRPS